jgi:putative hydrolase
MNQVRRAVDEIRAGADWHGAQAILLLMTDEQRELFAKMQALMSLLEGHASYVMNRVVANEVADVDRMRRSLHERRQTGGVEKSFQRAIGFETKIAQYDAGERFVRSIVDEVGMAGFNRVWERPEHLPLPAEIADPGRWVARVATR